ncbi:cytochrome C [Luteimonas chenhongjianii]|uniref:Cytochrome C n=1 Tax=Luteimonas chenhongjianii TaxID=2006110 RepID=A0A290XBX7_9GAMM|nr:cytochrome C [Luteimonas chenhongjianii]RPD85106.1 cytochrome c4 [Luteimonas sp. 100069]
MRHARAFGIAGLVVLAVGAVAFAQSTVQPLPDAPPVETRDLNDNAVAELAEATYGDAQRGAQLAGTCAACHGLDGNADADPSLYPRIAGQNERYVAHQLALFKSGQRQSPIMQPYAMPLSAQDMRDLGAHYAQQSSGAGIADDAVVESGPYAGMKFYEIGQTLFRSGNTERGIPACMACHGPAGSGNPGPAYPHVGGQQAWYSAARLYTYREGQTLEDNRHLFDVMASVARQLSDEEIEALASYMQGLHHRPDPAMLAAIEAQAAATPAPATMPENQPVPATDPSAQQAQDAEPAPQAQ